MPMRLDSAADHAGVAIILYKVAHARPGIISVDQLNGLVLAVIVRATAVGQNAVLAGDPKMFRLLCNTNLNMNIPSRGSEEERIRILLRVWANIQSDGYNK